MATAEVYAASTVAVEHFQPIIESQATKGSRTHVEFDPSKHLAYEYPKEIIMMKDIGYDEDTGVSPVAVSQPFRLFTHEAVQAMRDQVLSEEVLKNCSYKSNLAPCQVRGYASKYAPFIYDAWSHPETLKIMSKVAGVELIHNMNFEIGNVNISVKSERESKEEVAALKREKQSHSKSAEKPVVGWHTDSYPFVCVLMLSDCTDMIGGETALRTGDGKVLKVRGPQMLYYEFGEYRLEMLQERVRVQLERLRKSHAAGKKTNTLALKEFLAEQEVFIRHTNAELVPDDQVVPGLSPEFDIPEAAPPVRMSVPRARLA